MTTTIELTSQVQFGDNEISEIKVAPLSFSALAKIWLEVAVAQSANTGVTSAALMQRRRIAHQAHFMSNGKRVTPEPAHIVQLPIAIAKAIIAALDVGEGVAGSLLNDGDGISAPVHYKLGNPLEIQSNGKASKITELEFRAQVYGDVEDVLATDGDVPQALELIRKVATPIDAGSIKRLPQALIDRISVADGVTIMQQVLPRFLG